jgi:hypothetical protein
VTTNVIGRLGQASCANATGVGAHSTVNASAAAAALLKR